MKDSPLFRLGRIMKINKQATNVSVDLNYGGSRFVIGRYLKNTNSILLYTAFIGFSKHVDR